MKNKKNKIIKVGFHRKIRKNRGSFSCVDKYYIKAKKQGYRARSVYKLKEIQDRFNLIESNFNVLDIGSAPGSFLQFISKIVKEKIIIGVDLQKIENLNQKNIKTFVGDIFDFDFVCKNILELSGIEKFDLITSDIAPNTTGRNDIDQFNSVELNICICKFANKFLKKGGNMILKVFKGEDFFILSKEIKKIFLSMKTYKPLACRDSSLEEYIICFGKK